MANSEGVEVAESEFHKRSRSFAFVRVRLETRFLFACAEYPGAGSTISLANLHMNKKACKKYVHRERENDKTALDSTVFRKLNHRKVKAFCGLNSYKRQGNS